MTAPRIIPEPHDPARAARTLSELEGQGLDIGARERTLLAAAFGNSPYLARVALRDRAVLAHALKIGAERAFDEILAGTMRAAATPDEDEAMAILRRAKRAAALVIALADIGGVWDVARVTLALSRFADTAVSAALRFLLRQTANAASLPERSDDALEAGTGLVVLAMGKHGAFELNYSSDIDLVVFYDQARFPFRKKDDARAAAVDIVRGLVRLLAETTADGYVFRVDLRLRPDAGATQVAISTDAAEDYYEAMGQNWERAALIKARPCAGDIAAATKFLKAIEPFVWRRNLDYAAIEDIHAIKRQIHAHGGHAVVAVAGHNIKLGRGGIREIEFFVQTQQLILGGRNPRLRARATLAALAALRDHGHVSRSVADDLTRAYLFLRRLEHRLQMVEDEQTHTLPKTAEGLAHIACFSGYASVPEFEASLRRQLEIVESHYARLFEREAPLSAARGSLVFTGVEDDPATLETLTRMGFKSAAHMAAVIRGWHHGRIRATRSARARELLTKLVPALLDALAATADPDAAFAQFDRFLTRLPAGVQLFSLLLANTHLLALVATVAGSAPRLAEHMARTPAMLDALMDRDFLTTLPSRPELAAALDAALSRADGFEASLDTARRFVREQNFRVGVQIIEGRLSADAAGAAFSLLADCTIARLLGVVEDELARTAGRVKDGAFAVVAMGKLGGREMTATSDLDLVFIYDAPQSVEASDGGKPLAVSTYYARLAQRLIAALTAATAEGTLYDVDMRLRPSGNKGPVAVSLEAFCRYQADHAWTWERMALTRARVVAGTALAQKVEAAMRAVLQRPRADIRKDAKEMRAKLAAQFPGKSRWDLKFTPGGLVDIEFIAQTLLLEQAPSRPQLLHTNTVAALQALGAAAALPAADAATLIGAAELQQAVTQVLKLAVDGTLDPAAATPGLKTLLARAGRADSFDALEAALAQAQEKTCAIFGRVFATLQA